MFILLAFLQRINWSGHCAYPTPLLLPDFLGPFYCYSRLRVVLLPMVSILTCFLEGWIHAAETTSPDYSGKLKCAGIHTHPS